MVISPRPFCADIPAIFAGGSSQRPRQSMPNFGWRLQLREAEEVHDLFGRLLGRQHTGQQNMEKKITRPQTDEQRGERA